jgi:hypothetical protein
MNFIYTCIHCDSDFVRSIASHSIAAGTRFLLRCMVAVLPFAHCVYGKHICRIGENKLTIALRAIIYINREGLYEFSNSDFNTADAETLIVYFKCLLSS